MSMPLTPSKRPFNRNPLEAVGRGKLQKSTFHSQHPSSSGATVFRVLCPTSKSGGVIGKGGRVITQIRRETGVQVTVEKTIPGCDERIITIVGSDKDADAISEQKKDDEEDDNKEDDESNGAANEGDDVKEDDENADAKCVGSAVDSLSEKIIPAAQKALLLVFERIVEGDVETDGDDEEGKKPFLFVRLLVHSSQVGCVMGRGGSIIKRMTAESGAQIRICPRDKLPLCASSSDEVVQITGELDAIKKALQLISKQLMENPPRDRDSVPSLSSSHQFGPILSQPEVHPHTNFHFPLQAAHYTARPHHDLDFHPHLAASIPKFQEGVFPHPMNISEEVLTFRLLCADEKVGGLIGKGGNIIRTLKLETGCDIKILDAVPDSDERIIVISAMAHPDDGISAAQDAVLRVQSRIVTAVLDSKEKTVLSRLLVSSSQIGCLLGKGGAIIAEMRKLSRAHIRILGKDQIPKCASENEEVIHITGEFEAVQEALLQITTRLRDHLFRNNFPSMNHPSHTAFPEQVPPPFPPYIGRRGGSPPRMHSNLGSSFHKFDTVGGLPPLDDRSAFPRGVYRPGFPPHGSERVPSSAPWGTQGMIDGGGPIVASDYAGARHRRIGGFGGGNQQAIITNTTVEVTVPRSLIPSIVGEDEGCLKQIRQISGAKITITEPKPGATETAIIISGTPEETHAAQSLLQAFVMSETGSP